MRNILKAISLAILLLGTISSCEDRYGIDSQTDKIIKKLILISDSVYSFEALKPREVVISINSSTPWKCVSSETWCAVSPNSSDSSSLITEISIRLEENAANNKERTATLTFSALDINDHIIVSIIQNGASLP